MRFNLEAMCLKLWPSCTISQPPPPVREVHRLHVLGMDTQHSGALVWEAISSVAGVEDVVVNRRLGQVTVTGTAPIDSIVSAVSGTGKMVCAVSGTSGANGKDDVSDASTHSARRREYDLRASCFCGAVEVAVDSKASPVSTSICHCANCRRISGAPFLANVILSSAAVEVRCEGSGDAGLIDDATSLNTHGVSRRRCAKYAPHLPMCYSNSAPGCFPNSAHVGVQFVTPSPNVGPIRRTPIFGPIRHTPLRLFPPPSNWPHLPYFVPMNRQSNLLPIDFVHRCFSPICSTLGPELVVVYSSLFQTPHPKCWAAHHHKWYAHRVIDLPDKSLKYLHDFGGERCFFLVFFYPGGERSPRLWGREVFLL